MDETSSALTAEDVRGITFDKPPWGKRGYDEKSVNDFCNSRHGDWRVVGICRRMTCAASDSEAANRQARLRRS
jgi:DivIVA domain-containing protein